MVIGNKAIRAFLATLLFAILYSTVPWDTLSGTGLEDREVYAEKIKYGLFMTEEKDITGLIEGFSNEILWNLGIQLLSTEFSIDVNLIFFCISVLCIFVFSYSLQKYYGWPSLILLINPLVVDLAFSQLRSALAISILILALWAWKKSHKILSGILLLVSAFIHSIIPIIFIMIVAILLFYKKKPKMPMYVYSIFGVITGLLVVAVLGPLRNEILGSIGDRRAEYDVAYISFGYMSFWVITLILLSVKLPRARLGEEMVIVTSYSISIITIFAGLALLGLPSIRFLSIAYPALMSSIMALPNKLKIICLIAFTLYSFIQWFYWL